MGRRVIRSLILVCMVYTCSNLHLPVSSGDILCKRVRSRSGPTGCRSWFGFETLEVFLELFFSKKVILNLQKNAELAMSRQRVNLVCYSKSSSGTPCSAIVAYSIFA